MQTTTIAQDPFYNGKTVTLVVGYSAGGGYDIYARMLARHYGRHIPGNPNVIVQNMPGAASMTSVRYLDATAPKDGTVITMFDPGLITQVLTADKPVVNFANFQWVGTLLRDIRICYAWGATGIKTFGDMMKRKEFLIGTTAKGSNAYVNGAILRNVFKAPVRQIAGYPGSNEQRLALERGELEGNCGSWTAMPQEWLVGNRINALLRFSATRPADMAPDVPYVLDLASSPEQRAVIDILNSPGELGRPFIVAKQVPRGAGGDPARRTAGDAEGRSVPGRREEAEPAARPGRGRGSREDHGADLCRAARADPQSQGRVRIVTSSDRPGLSSARPRESGDPFLLQTGFPLAAGMSGG